MTIENHGKSHTPKFEGEDICLAEIDKLNGLPNYQCRYSLDVALDCIDRFHIYKAIINVRMAMKI